MRLVDADREAEQAYDFRQRAGLARSLQEHGLAKLFDHAARLCMAKAEVFQGLQGSRRISKLPTNTTTFFKKNWKAS